MNEYYLSSNHKVLPSVDSKREQSKLLNPTASTHPYVACLYDHHYLWDTLPRPAIQTAHLTFDPPILYDHHHALFTDRLSIPFSAYVPALVR
jgi:hypothetical protein